MMLFFTGLVVGLVIALSLFVLVLVKFAKGLNW